MAAVDQNMELPLVLTVNLGSAAQSMDGVESQKSIAAFRTAATMLLEYVGDVNWRYLVDRAVSY
jgi:hypothetical protein